MNNTEFQKFLVAQKENFEFKKRAIEIKGKIERLKEENSRLKKMFADLSLDHSILKEVITKKGWAPGGKSN